MTELKIPCSRHREKNAVSGIPNDKPRTRKKKKSVQSMSAKGPRTSERAGNAYTPNFLDRLYVTLWLKAHRFKLNVCFLKNKRQPKLEWPSARNSKESFFKIISIRSSNSRGNLGGL